MIDKEKIWQALDGVIDPEVGESIVAMGLVYGVEMDEVKNEVMITMTLTSPSCPLGPWFIDKIKTDIKEAVTIEKLTVEVMITFDPPWSQEAMSEELKLKLGV